MLFEKTLSQQHLIWLESQAANAFNSAEFESALEYCLEMLRFQPTSAAFYRNLAECYSQLFEPHESIRHFETYLQLSGSQDVLDLRQYSDYMLQAGELDEAERIVTYLQKDSSERCLDLGWHHFRKRQYQQAFELTARGKQLGNILWIGHERYNNLPNCARWRGESLEGKTLCVVGECGLGDEFIFARWIPDLLQLCPQVWYLTNNTIGDVIVRLFPIQPHASDNTYDYWVPSMHLPLLLKKYDPVRPSYITPNRTYVEKWRHKLAALGDFYCFSWTGSDQYAHNHFRDIPIEYFAQKLGSKAHLVSVCMQAATCPPELVNLKPEIESWEDTLAILSLSQLNFCSCSSVSHASGSMGKRTFVYTRPDDYFTWCGTTSGEITPWYQDVTVWRTSQIGRWHHIIDESLKHV